MAKSYRYLTVLLNTECSLDLVAHRRTQLGPAHIKIHFRSRSHQDDVRTVLLIPNVSQDLVVYITLCFFLDMSPALTTPIHVKSISSRTHHDDGEPLSNSLFHFRYSKGPHGYDRSVSCVCLWCPQIHPIHVKSISSQGPTTTMALFISEIPQDPMLQTLCFIYTPSVHTIWPVQEISILSEGPTTTMALFIWDTPQDLVLQTLCFIYALHTPNMDLCREIHFIRRSHHDDGVPLSNSPVHLQSSTGPLGINAAFLIYAIGAYNLDLCTNIYLIS